MKSMKKIIRSIFVLVSCYIALFSYLQAKPMEYKYLGKNNAPVIMYDFASLSCVHCADFSNNIMPQLIKDYVITGKLKIIFIDVPFGSPNNLYAHTVLHYTSSNEDFFQLAHALFANQDKWVQANNPVTEIKKYTTLLGMSDTTLNKAINDKTLQKWLKDNATKQISALHIQGTPTLFFVKKGEKLTPASTSIVGVPDYKKLQNTIDNLIKKTKSS